MPKRAYSGAIASRKRPRYAPKKAVWKAPNVRTGGFTGIERKFIDYEVDKAVVKSMAGGEVDPATGSISAIAQGDGESNRDGRKCVLKQVMVRGYVELNGLDDQGDEILTQAATVFVALVQDTQSNGAQLNAEDVYDDPTDTDLDPLAYRNLQFSKRFRVLQTKLLQLTPQVFSKSGGASTDQQTAPVRRPFMFMKNVNIPVNHSGTTADISTVTDDSLHVLAWSGAADGTCTIRYISRVRFVG